MPLAHNPSIHRSTGPTLQNSTDPPIHQSINPSIQNPTSYEPHTLRHDLERHGRLPIADCVQIGLSLATVLAHLHKQGLVHRDIKPSNILFVDGVAKLGDIGLVTEAGDTKSIVGTEGYLPPEGPGTRQADLFSLGKVLYEMSTGMDRRRFAELPDDLRDWPDRNAVFEFNAVVLRARAKDPAERYQTADQLRAELALLQEGKSVSQKRSNERRWAARKKVGLGLFTFAAITLAVLSVVRRNSQPKVVEEGLPSTNHYANALCENKAMGDILYGADQFHTTQKYDQYRRTFGTLGERGYLDELLRQAKEDPKSDHYSMACLQIQLGETNAALRSLNECYEKRERVGMESRLIYLIFDECWDGVREDRRFQELLDKIGFTQMMRNGKK